MPCVLFQMVLTLGTGAPIFILFPLLMYYPSVGNWLRKLLEAGRHESRVAPADVLMDGLSRRRLGLLGVSQPHGRRPRAFSEWEGSIAQNEVKRSLYWRHRFIFAVLLWMNFISFISADFAMLALPVPEIACFLSDKDEWILKADPSFVCFSTEMASSHLAGAILVLVFTVIFPVVVYSKIRKISAFNMWDDEDCLFELGYFYDCYKKNWRYLFIMNHLQLCVLLTLFGAIFSLDELGMVIAPTILHFLYLGVVVVGQPLGSRLDNILEAVLVAINIFGLGLSLLLIRDPQNVVIEVRTRECQQPHLPAAF